MTRMRFAYLDREGREVRLAGEEAVKAGIRHGTIEAETLLFDAEAGGWARAECHPFYQEVHTEDAEAAGERESPGAHAPDEPSIQEMWRFPARFAGGGEGRAPEGEVKGGDESPSDLEDMGIELSFPVDDGEETPSPTGESRETGPDEPEEGEGDQERVGRVPGDDHLILDIGGGAPRPPRPEEPGKDLKGGALKAGDAGRGQRRDSGGVPPVERGTAAGGSRDRPRGAGRSGNPLTSGAGRATPSRRRRAVAVSSVALLAAVALAAGVLRSEDDPQAQGQADEAAALASAEAEARAREDSVLNLIRPAGLAARILRVMERADGDVAEALRARASRDSLPEAPPDAWLEGAYLAQAGDYPAVPEYWVALGRWTSEVRSDLPRLVEEAYAARLREGGFTGRTGELLLQEAMEDFHGRSSRREGAFGPMEDLVGGALDLHDLLVEREAEIEYEPFSRERITRDPILEAVASNPELEEEIWTRITRITRALETMESLESPTTDRIQGWMVRQLRTSLGSPGGPGAE